MNIYWEEQEYSGERKKPEIDEAIDVADVKIYTPPPVVGGYDITGSNQVEGSIVFNYTKKPNWFHRACTRFFLGWKWKDAKKQEKKSGLLLG
jgi:hypothetical protein